MTIFFKMLQLASIVTTTSAVVLSVEGAQQPNNQTINLQKNNLQDWRIEKLPDLSSWAEDMTIFNNELYIGMARGEIAKIDKQGKMTYLVDDKTHGKIMATTEFNNYLYFAGNSGKLAKIDKQNKVTYLEKSMDYQILAMVEFNNYLYIALDSGRIYKMDKNENITFVNLSISYTDIVRRMIVFNDHLYFGRIDGQLFKIDKNEKLTKFDKNFNNIMTLKIFNDELYIGTGPTNSGTIFKLDKQDNVSFVATTQGGVLTLEVFENNLYIGLWNKYLWKLNNQGQIEKLDYVASSYFRTMCSFNGELYISHDVYEFSKLTNK